MDRGTKFIFKSKEKLKVDDPFVSKIYGVPLRPALRVVMQLKPLYRGYRKKIHKVSAYSTYRWQTKDPEAQEKAKMTWKVMNRDKIKYGKTHYLGYSTVREHIYFTSSKIQSPALKMNQKPSHSFKSGNGCHIHFSQQRGVFTQKTEILRS